MQKNLRGEIQYDEEIWRGVSQEAKDALNLMLSKDPENRPTAKEALQLKWLQLKFNSLTIIPSSVINNLKPCDTRSDIDKVLLRTESSLFLSFDSKQLNPNENSEDGTFVKNALNRVTKHIIICLN